MVAISAKRGRVGRQRESGLRVREERCVRTGKRRYPTELDAKLVLAKISTRRSSKREECRCYRCALCGGWHLTSMPLGGGEEKS